MFPNLKYYDNDFELQVMCDNLEIEKGMRVLDLGCCDSNLSEVLQKQGCEAWGVDLRPYTNAPFKFFQEDFLKCKLPENYFDIVVDVSTLHHLGVGYLDSPGAVEDFDADIKAVRKIFEILKPGGLFYVSTNHFSFSYQILKGLCRLYSIDSFLERVAKPFKILEIKYYVARQYPLTFYRTLDEFKLDEVKRIQFFAKLEKEQTG